MKRFISIILAVLTVMGAMMASIPLSLAATGGEGEFIYVDDKGAEVSVSLADALTALPAEATIKLNASKTTSDCDLTLGAGRTLTIDLNGHTYTTTADTYLFSSIKGTLIIKNGTIVTKRGLVVNGGGVLELDGVTGSSINRPFIKLSGEGTTTANINDCNLSINANGENLILIENGTDGILNVTGNSVLSHTGASVGGTNCAVIQIQQPSNDITKPDTDATITVGAGSEIRSAYSLDNDNRRMWGGCIVDSTYGNVDIFLEKDSVMSIERKFAALTHFVFEQVTSGTSADGTVSKNGKTTVYDGGAIFKANKVALANGVYFPRLVKDGATQIGYLGSDKNIYHEGCNVVLNSDDVTFTSLYYNANDFDMLNGASIRTVNGELGIRFSTHVSSYLVNMFGKNIRFGAVIAPGVSPDDDPKEHVDYVEIKSTKFQREFINDSYKYDNVFHSAVIMPTNVPQKVAYELSLAARAYMEITYVDGSAQRYYTDFDNNNIRSMSRVAYNLGEEYYNKNSVVRDIVDNSASYFIDVVNKDTGIKIVYGANGSKQLAQSLADAIKAKTGVTISPSYIGSYNADAFEIVIGDNTYSESKSVIADLGYSEGMIKVIDKKIIIVGYDSNALTFAVNKFIESLGHLSDGQGNISVPNNYSRSVAENHLFAQLPVMSGYAPTFVDTGDGCYMTTFGRYQETLFRRYLNTLTSEGYRLYASKTIDGNEYYTYTNDIAVITAIYTKYNKTCKILVERLKDTELPVRAEDNVYTPVKGLESSITQIGLYYDNGSKSKENYFNGMSYVIRLDDGSFIVVDGGHDKLIDAEHIYRVLQKQAYNPNNIVIAAWIFSHGHSDHMGAFLYFAKNYSAKIKIERFIYNYPTAEKNGGTVGGLQNDVESVLTSHFANVPTIKAHPGQEFNIRNARITMLYTVDVYESILSDYNNSCLVWKMELEGKSVLFLADYSENGETLINLYSDATLKSDMVQVAHHGISGQQSTIYEKIAPEYAFWPVGDYHVTYTDANGYHDLHLDQLAANSYLMNMDQSKVFLATDDITVMTVNDGNVSVDIYTDATDFLRRASTTASIYDPYSVYDDVIHSRNDWFY